LNMLINDNAEKEGSMKKTHRFNELSDNGNITKCYGHYLVARYRGGHDRVGNRKDRVRFIPGVV